MAANEIIHEVARKKVEVFLKLDYEKAYDRVNWNFLEEVLSSRGFSAKWISWVISLVKGGSVCVRINEENSKYFITGKGLRRGDPLSPLLFNIVVDVFTKMLIKAARRGLVQGLLPGLHEGGIISLQYADDTLLFLKNDFQQARHFKWLLACFENLSGMKINYNKSDLLTLGIDEEENKKYAMLFCCNIGSFPIKYLGVPLHFTKLKREDIQPVVVKLIKRVAGWRGKLLSIAGKLVLLKSCLATIPIYLLSVIKFPKWAIESINSQMANFIRNDSEGKHKYHLANWPSLTRRREYGGWGTPDLSNLTSVFLPLGSIDTSWVKARFGKKLLTKNIIAEIPTSFAALISMLLPFGGESYGLAKLPAWG